MADLVAYGGLFLSALLAATILPMQSESVLVGFLLTDRYPAWVLLTVASLGNVLGAIINWLLGRFIERFRDRKWFPVNAAQLDRAQNWYRRYGKWSLLLSWAPIIGDPLTVMAYCASRSRSSCCSSPSRKSDAIWFSRQPPTG
jgi:membrane protein YqaA with SNARE-associated domain